MLLLMLMFDASSPGSARVSPPRCEYDQHVLELGFEAFDQDLKGGWRALADREGCEDKAANIIRNYRMKYQSIIPLLYWHEAQIRAFTGEGKEAIALMEASRRPIDEDQWGWNPYADATIAFLRNDRSSFVQAQARLGRLPRPKDWPAGDEWPPNWRVVAGLWNCFGKPYKVAYGPSCRTMGK